MTPEQVEIQLIAAIVSVACALPGVFLVLRKMAMMSDAISHAILLGIVIAFLIVQDLQSPILILGAALTGVLTVSLVEMIFKTGLMKQDAAIGLVFPLLFSLGVILVTRFADHVHLDIDSVLLGELAFAPFNRLEVAGVDIGPKSLWVMLVILLINIMFIMLFYKELKLATFDVGLAASLGLMPAALHYSLMSLVSITAVGAFDAVGAVLVVALIIIPPSSAYLLTNRLTYMLLLSALFGIISAIGGYWTAHFLDASIAGSMVSVTGLIFLMAYLFAPHRGMVAIIRRRENQKWEFARSMLAVHVFHHEGTPEAELECGLDHLQAHFRWEEKFANRAVKSARRHKLVELKNDLLTLTSEGKVYAQKVLTR